MELPSSGKETRSLARCLVDSIRPQNTYFHDDELKLTAGLAEAPTDLRVGSSLHQTLAIYLQSADVYRRHNRDQVVRRSGFIMI